MVDPPAGGLLSRMFIVYAIHNAEKDAIYIGQTADLQKRLMRHNGELPSRPGSYTKRLSGTWKLVYDEPAADRAAARKRERQLKSAAGRKFLWDIIKQTAHSSVGRAVAS